MLGSTVSRLPPRPQVPPVGALEDVICGIGPR